MFVNNNDFRAQGRMPDLLLETKDFDSYSPESIVVYAGTSAESVREIKRMILQKNNEWVTLATSNEMVSVVPNLFDSPQSFYKIEILSNHNGGINTKISAIRVDRLTDFSFKSIPCTPDNSRVSSGVVTRLPGSFSFPSVQSIPIPSSSASGSVGGGIFNTPVSVSKPPPLFISPDHFVDTKFDSNLKGLNLTL
jgi:hypothetical protein